MRKSNYDKSPFIPMEGELTKGWEDICQTLRQEAEAKRLCVIECYQGVYIEEVKQAVTRMGFDTVIKADDLFKTEEEIRRMTQPWVTDDRLFGRRADDDFSGHQKQSPRRLEIRRADGALFFERALGSHRRSGRGRCRPAQGHQVPGSPARVQCRRHDQVNNLHF